MPVHDLDLLIDAASHAGDIAKTFWCQDPETWDKGGTAGPVTEADLAIDKMLAAELGSNRPDYGWLSEETEDSTARQDHEHVFIVDPIDGTRAFINGSPTFSHSLAIARDGQVTAAVVYLPMLDRMYAATIDGSATLNGDPITATDTADLDGATALASKPNMLPDFWHADPPPVERHFRSSLAYRLCLVAQGRFDLMLTLRDTWEWDVAAGSLIAQQAGATVTTMHGGPIAFNNPRPMLAGMVAGNADLHGQIIAALP